MIGKLLDKLALLATSRPTFHFKGEESVRDKAAWQASSAKKKATPRTQGPTTAHFNERPTDP
jgi:hypothetical protein